MISPYAMRGVPLLCIHRGRFREQSKADTVSIVGSCRGHAVTKSQTMQ